MARIMRRTGFRRRPKRNYQWARFTSADTAIKVAPAFYTEDLLTTLKSEYGFSVNFPDITIWRIHLRISVAIKWTNPVVNLEQNGVVVGVFVDDPAFTLQGVNTHPYMEKFMMYKMCYYSEAMMLGDRIPANGATDFFMKDFDIKTRRRLGNIEDSLILQVGPSGSGVAELDGLSYSGSVLLSLGRR